MAKLGLPRIIISFKEKGIAAIGRSERGIIAMILKEESVAPFTEKSYTVYTTTDIPEELSADNKEQLELALMGYVNSPRHIVVHVLKSDSENYNEVLLELEHTRFDYLVIPEIKPEETTTIASWIKGMRTLKNKKVKAVLPNCSADDEGVINFTNTKIKTATKEFTAAQYCSRIAGIICGTPMTISCTYAPLAEVIDCDKYTSDEMDDKIGNGELFIMYDGEKFKIARGVNSLVTTTEGKLNQFKKIKLIDLMDMIYDDIYTTCRDEYIGKYANSYKNKCLVICAILGYYKQLELEGLLEVNQNTCEIDIDSVSAWLLSNGKKTQEELASMKEQELKESNTQDNLFLAANISMLDAIENITLNIGI